MWYERHFSNNWTTLCTQFPVLVVTGARQVGKSSLIRKIFPSHRYVVLDLPSEAAEAENNPSQFLDRHPAPLIIDEIQYAPSLLRYIKQRVDSAPGQRGQYILTGSQKFSLMKGVRESLAGRAALVELFPFSLSEIDGTPNPGLKDASIEALMLRGGYPALYQNPQIETRDYFRSYVGTYLERDVKDVLNVSSHRDFERFMRLAALRTASLVNKAELAKDVGISAPTANEWLSVLQISNQVHLLEPWFTNRSKSIIKSPKLYFFDTGLLCFLLNIHSLNELMRSPMLGQIWENFVFCELYKQLSLAGAEGSLRFWRDRSYELDFVIDRGGVLDVFDAKWTETPGTDDLRQIRYFSNYIKGNQLMQRGILCRTPKSYPIDQDSLALNPRDLGLSKIIR